MVRLHWFWRAAIAVFLGGVTQFVLIVLAERYLPPRGVGVDLGDLAVGAFLFFLPPVTTLAIHAAVSRRDGDSPQETRCRKCGYILRGIPEPRCSECGERI